MSVSVLNLTVTNKSQMARDITKAKNNYFTEQGISIKGGRGLIFKALFFFLGFWTLYGIIVFSHLPLLVKLLLCIPAVFFACGIGFNIMHDGNHESFSENKRIKRIAANAARSLGVEVFLWKTKHNVIHHRGTNVNHIDDDIEAGPLLRLHSDQPHYLIHRLQHWYWPIAYSFLFLAWVGVKDFKKYFSQKIMGVSVSFGFWDHVLFWATKVFFYFAFIQIPIWKLGFTAWIYGFLLFAFLLGFTISVVFQMAHIVQGLKHPVFEEVNGTESMEHQISTTADFAPNNKFLRWWVGGLTFQIEHHLFPKVCHVHYPALHKIVKAVCEEHHFPMVVFPTFFAALKSHVLKLKEFGKKPIVVQLS